MMKLVKNANLPNYLEEAWSPLVWSNVFSEDFKNEVVTTVLMAVNPNESLDHFRESLSHMKFLDEEFKTQLINAMERYIRENRNTER